MSLNHIAFIMDGNGRWAKRRGLTRTMGHAVGYTRVKTVVKRCSELKIPVVSMYAFSTENWKRPQSEIDEIFRIIRENMRKDIPMFNENNIKVVTSGDVTKFPQDLQDSLKDVKEQTEKNTGTILNLCVNYGGRADIAQAVYRGGNEFEKHLYSAQLPYPDVDLMVRTSGEQRISNFMLWELAYAEFLFVKRHWPSMTERMVDKCVRAFGKRKRRFGKIKEEKK